MTDVFEFIENLKIQSEYIVAAISGGPDSMCLLDILRQKCDKCKIVVAHVHHNLRKESDEEAEKLEDYCKVNNLIFEMMKIEKYPNDIFSEEIARKYRYEFFEKLIKKYNSEFLFTAHHGDDQIETILMRLTRGSSLKGYCGIETISKRLDYVIIRPLLFLKKEDIVKYLDDNNISYSIDKSNYSLKYTRNRYRKNILSVLKQENGNVHHKFNEFSNKLLLADNYIKKQAKIYYKQIVFGQNINVLEFNKLDEILKFYILEDFFQEIYKENIKLINNKHIEIIIKCMLKNNNIILDLPDNKKAIIEYNNFKICDFINTKDYEYEFVDSVILPDGKKIFIDNKSELSSNFVIHLNSSEIKLPFIVRNRRKGDSIKVKNLGGTKKVNDIFTNSKVSKQDRDIYPIVTDRDGTIIWIPGIKKSHFDRKKDKNYDIILRYD